MENVRMPDDQVQIQIHKIIALIKQESYIIWKSWKTWKITHFLRKVRENLEKLGNLLQLYQSTDIVFHYVLVCFSYP